MSDKSQLKPLRIVNGGILVPSFPKTVPVRFEKYVLCNPQGSDFQFLVQLSNSRSEVVKAMEEGSPASVLRVVCEYLPLLWRFMSSLKQGAGVRLSSPLEFDWSSAFQDNDKKMKAKIYTFHSIDVEMLMVLVCFAVAHLQTGAEKLSQMMSEKQLAEAAKDVNVHFLGASGIFEYVKTHILPMHVLSKERPIELLQPFHVCMTKVSLMMANAVLLRKSIEDNMKPVSKCRLALYSHQLVSEADDALRSLGIDMDLIPLPLSLYVRCHKIYYLVFANRVIGEAAWEAKEYGKGLGYLTRAVRMLDTIGNDVIEAKSDPHCASVGSKIGNYGAEVHEKKNEFQKENDSIYYERVLHTDENLPLAEPFVAVQVKAFDLLLPIDPGLLLTFK